MKVYLDTIGCRLNQAEIEQFARQLRAAGHSLAATPAEAELAVVNTCLVTAAAESDSRQKVRQMARAGVPEVVVTGCWATMKPAEAAALPAVSRVVSNLDKDHLVPDLLQMPLESFDREPVERELIPGARLRTRAFIKVQDGCDNHCTFCITTQARGVGRSLPIAEVLAQIHQAIGNSNAESLSETGAREIVLTGVHLGSWGHELSPRLKLADLVRAILDHTPVTRLRLSSLEPWDLDPDFFTLWQDARLCRHLHLPLQSGSAATLRRMARKTSPAAFADLVRAARRLIPDVAVTTDIIAGFPGETEAEFAESLGFVQQIQFAGGHVFTYSSRPGTAAARFPGQVPQAVRKARSAQLRQAIEADSLAYQQRFIGHRLEVLWESATALDADGWELSGLSDNYLRVKARTPRSLWNQVTPVTITGLVDDGLEGVL
jgi:threonylcarbamoyladenosine tRNA methylthiotransferase MtaB